MILKTTEKSTLKYLIIADLLTIGKFLVNLIFICVFFILLIEMKSMLRIDIFPNFNFPLDEMIRDFF